MTTKTNQEKIDEAFFKKQEQNKQEFLSTIFKILSEDWSQTCNDAKGTRVRMQTINRRQTIIIEEGISNNTLTALNQTNYLLSCEEETGKLQIENLVLGRKEE